MSKRVLLEEDRTLLPPKKAFKYRGFVGASVEVDFNGFKKHSQRDTSVIPGVVTAFNSHTATVKLGTNAH